MDRGLSISDVLWIGIGGMAGSLLRALTELIITSPFPIATLLVNLSGCALLGVLYSLEHRLTRPVRLFHMVGFCGSLTTVSLFSAETIQFWNNHEPGLAVLNVTLNFMFSLPLVMMLIHLMERRRLG